MSAKKKPRRGKVICYEWQLSAGNVDRIDFARSGSSLIAYPGWPFWEFRRKWPV